MCCPLGLQTHACGSRACHSSQSKVLDCFPRTSDKRYRRRISVPAKIWPSSVARGSVTATVDDRTLGRLAGSPSFSACFRLTTGTQSFKPKRYHRGCLHIHNLPNMRAQKQSGRATMVNAFTLLLPWLLPPVSVPALVGSRLPTLAGLRLQRCAGIS